MAIINTASAFNRGEGVDGGLSRRLDDSPDSHEAGAHENRRWCIKPCFCTGVTASEKFLGRHPPLADLAWDY